MSSLLSFHPTVRRWFADRLGDPTPAQDAAWPAIAQGRHVLLAAPTGSGKTLAAFLHALDQLLQSEGPLADETRVLYVSPLKALSNDVQKNLQEPLRQLRELDPNLPEIRVMVRTGDTPASQRTAMGKKPPQILVTTPESLYILLTSDGGRAMLRTVHSVIVDEIHAVVANKRGSHLALSLERLESLAGPLQRIGLSATQKPLEDVARFLVGPDRPCEVLDMGHLRKLDLRVEIPASPLETVCSHETWSEIHDQIAAMIDAHRTTLIFVNTRKMAERITAQLSKLVGEENVACHHGSLSRERRLEAEQRLKAGELRALVATASLELGIDIGDVDLVVQCGSTRSIATFLQRVGRAGHGVGRVPKGRIFPLTQDELVEATALVRATRRGILDRILSAGAPLDILTQQLVAACVAEDWPETDLYQLARRSQPFHDLTRDDFEACLNLHTDGRWALLHRDGVQGRVRGTRRARMPAITSGGAIADNADYRVVLEPSGTFVGTINEDFAIESSAGDIFQLGNMSWQILKVEQGTVRVADAHGAPPTLPFWLGEAPARSAELSGEFAALREDIADGIDLNELSDAASLVDGAAEQLVEFVRDGVRVLGCVPTQRRVVAERFFDETGGMQLVLHAPFGGRITRAWGLALRKKFCRSFGFELQAAANEESIVLSLGPQHSFPLDEVFQYLTAQTAREALVQAVLPTPMFQSRWRWNVSRALLVPRMQGGRRVPAPLLRMRADDRLVQAFPDVMACGETLPAGDLEVPMDHPLVRQTIEDCLHEAMDIDGLERVLRQIADGTIETVAVDTNEPSAFARGILNAMPYSFLDDAPLEERRTQAVLQRRGLEPKRLDEIGALDADAVQRVRDEAWPDPRSADEVHEALLWMGYVQDEEATPWAAWLDELAAAGRVQHEDDRWIAAEVDRDPVALLRGRMEALGPVASEDPNLPRLEAEGLVLRVRLEGQEMWCHRRLLARIHRYTLERLRSEIEPVPTATFLQFLHRWQHVDPTAQLEGPAGVAQVIAQLAGFDAPSVAWERDILPRRVRNYRPDLLDQLCLEGQVAWGRLYGGGNCAPRSAPVALFPREDWLRWMDLADPPSGAELSSHARQIRELLQRSGAMFSQELRQRLEQLPEYFERGVAELIGQGHLTCDSFRGVRQLLLPAAKRRQRLQPAGRWTLLERREERRPDPGFVARQLLDRYGVVFRKLLQRERQPVPWRDLARELRGMELAGEVRGGRFVAGFAGEQFALPEAVRQLRSIRRDPPAEVAEVASTDPLSLSGVLVPEHPLARRETG